jgi:hypothetical protein
MKKRTLPKVKNTQKIQRERDPLPWRYCLLTLVCGLFLVVGFFFAARQHFSSIEYGIKNSKLKNQLEEVVAEKRRLLLEKEVALTPAEIKKAAKKLGLSEITGEVIQAYQPAADKNEKVVADKKDDKKTPEAKSKPLVSDAIEKKSVKPESSTKKVEKVSIAKNLSKTGK